MKTVISIIIPMYNSSKFIINTLMQIYAQNNYGVNFEVIVIDDNSEDGSLHLVDEYQKRSGNTNLKIISLKTNAGTANARNVGLSHATGEWVQFLDSDDQLDNQFFAAVSKLNKDVDCYVYQTKSFYEDKLIERQITNCKDKRAIMLINVVVNKIYKRSCLVNFKPEFYMEDVVFLFEMLNKQLVVEKLDNICYYINRRNTNSKMWTKLDDSFLKMAQHCMQYAALSDDRYVKLACLEIFVGTLFSSNYPFKTRFQVASQVLFKFYYLLPKVISNGIRSWQKQKIYLADDELFYIKKFD